jgi:hypothetical protein
MSVSLNFLLSFQESKAHVEYPVAFSSWSCNDMKLRIRTVYDKTNRFRLDQINDKTATLLLFN